MPPAMATRFPALPVEPESGFSLVECLLAVAVFSLGLLGAGALISERLKESRAAHSYFLADMLAQDLVARIGASPSAAGGGELGAWQRQAASALPGLQCEVTALGGTPPAYRVEMSWPAGTGDDVRLVLWAGR